MAKTVIIDDLHLTVRVPSGLPETQAEVLRQTLAGYDFMNRLRRSVRAPPRAVPELTVVRVSLTRW